MNSEWEIRRAELRFAEEVSREFSFLLDAGFKVAETNPTLVRFQSPDILINVFHGRRSYELNIEVAQPERPDEAYPFYYLTWAASIEHIKYRVHSADTPESVAKRVEQLASIIKPCVEICVRKGIFKDKKLFDKFKQQSAVWSHEFARKQNLRVALRAWERQDYDEVVRILARWRDELTADERAILNEAEEKRRG